jgi:iron complex outermembrane receptor protein
MPLPSRRAAAVLLLSPCALAVAQTLSPEQASAAADERESRAGVITITGTRPTSLPTVIPTTIEGITGEQLRQQVNATDAPDALKYFPSLLVRKRYIGDYDHAVLSTRASGTGNSARSLVYADGILLSNLLGNGASFTPRWGLVTPEEIERVDVLYGPLARSRPPTQATASARWSTT